MLTRILYGTIAAMTAGTGAQIVVALDWVELARGLAVHWGGV